MRARNRRIGLGLLVAGAAVGLLLLGRLSADPAGARAAGQRDGQSRGYQDGYRVGDADGLKEGRALQEANALPSDAQQPAQAAFTAGYAAGANDVFSGYDGGWSLTMPYLVTLEPGGGAVTYAISSRKPLLPGTNYFLCADGHSICQAARPH